jgi:hypothetical protein
MMSASAMEHEQCCLIVTVSIAQSSLFLTNVALEKLHDSLEQLISGQVLDSIVVSIPACHAGDRGSIPRRGDAAFFDCTNTA